MLNKNDVELIYANSYIRSETQNWDVLHVIKEKPCESDGSGRDQLKQQQQQKTTKTIFSH